MFTHVALQTLSDGANRRAVAQGLTALVGVVPGLRSVTVLEDLGLSDANASLLFIAEFGSEEQWQAYRKHPAHMAVAREHIVPFLTGKTFLQAQGVLASATLDGAEDAL